MPWTAGAKPTDTAGLRLTIRTGKNGRPRSWAFGVATESAGAKCVVGPIAAHVELKTNSEKINFAGGPRYRGGGGHHQISAFPPSSILKVASTACFGVFVGF